MVELTMSFGGNGSGTAVTVTGDLGVEEAAQFRQMLGAVHRIVGPEVEVDLGSVVVQDEAGHAVLGRIIREYREFGGRIHLPAGAGDVESEAGQRPRTATPA
ncbi:hypothetical protein [Georgenia subflava]|nr:hypothetical protein [Georgenia subflava]